MKRTGDFLVKIAGSLWRSGRDSNPRVVSHKLISSQPRYDRFDTAAHISPLRNPFGKVRKTGGWLRWHPPCPVSFAIIAKKSALVNAHFSLFALFMRRRAELFTGLVPAHCSARRVCTLSISCFAASSPTQTPGKAGQSDPPHRTGAPGCPASGRWRGRRSARLS